MDTTGNILVIEELSAQMLKELKGGTAAVLNVVDNPPENGDGAKYVCCINIELPGNNPS